jgi:hypothetical protein
VDRQALLQALDQAIAAVRRLEADGHAAQGAPAGGRLQLLREELAARRAEVAAGDALDPEWVGRTVRSVAEWIPDEQLPLMARLGRIARLISAAP